MCVSPPLQKKMLQSVKPEMKSSLLPTGTNTQKFKGVVFEYLITVRHKTTFSQDKARKKKKIKEGR